MRLLAIDTETTGLDVQKDDIIELGYALYDSSKDAPLLFRNHTLVPKNPVTEEVTKITGITQEHINEFGIQPDEAFVELLNVIEIYKVQFFVAHNGVDYDIPILKANFIRAGLIFVNLPCIDTKMDLPLAYTPKSTSLVYMAADHGFINPFPHRALTDAMSCMKLLKHYNLDIVVAKASTPVVEIRADVRFENRDLAKKRMFNWDGERKIWVKRIRQYDLKEEKEKANFPILTL